VTQLDDIADRLGAVRERISAATRRSGRAPESVKLVLASKTQSPDAIRAAYAAGVRDFGENYVQEAQTKRDDTADLPDVRWHLIGHLQRNKAPIARNIFNLIHSLDNAALATALARAQPGLPACVLIEVNIAGEPSKNGVAPAEVERLIETARALVDIRGLMTIPPAGGEDVVRPYFASLRELRDRLARASGLALAELSMGMTEDFEKAIDEGATIVRVGRAVFGDRSR